MGTLTNAGKDIYANGGDVEPVKIVAHSGLPGTTGVDNRIAALAACSFTQASGGTGVRTLSADVTFSNLTGVTDVTHASVYNASDVCLHIAALTNPRTGLQDGDGVTLKASGPNAVTIQMS